MLANIAIWAPRRLRVKMAALVTAAVFLPALDLSLSEMLSRPKPLAAEWLSRELADRRIYPAIDLNASSTRREELILSSDALQVSRAIRRRLAEKPSVDALTELLGWMKRADSNADLISEVIAGD